MDALFYGDSNGSFFSFEPISKCRKVSYPMYPDRISAKLVGAPKVRIVPKQPGEVRLLSADIALMASTRHKNDATSIFVNQLLPTKAGRYVNNIVYTEAHEGMHTEDEALSIRKLYEEFDCDYIVLDVRNVGLSIYDALARDMSDPDTGEIYPALCCCNNADYAARCANRQTAKKAVWCISGSAKLNSDCALLLREGFRTGRIRLLKTEYDGEEELGAFKGYAGLSMHDRAELLMPYINTSLLVNELINLRHEESAGSIRVYEKSGMRKDRYSSLSYSFYVATQLEKDAKMRRRPDDEDGFFVYRAPKVK